MKVEPISYSAGSLKCQGQVVWDETIRTRRPVLLMAPNWLGITPRAIDDAKMLAGDRYVVFMADMYGEGSKPTGKENPMEFLAPLLKDANATRTRVVAAFNTMVKEADARDIGDTKRRAAIGYCFGGANVLDLARAGTDVAAVVSLHGSLGTTMPAKKGEVKAAVLIVHGAADPVAPKAERDAVEKEMDAAGARWAMLAWGGVVHSFTDAHANNPGMSMYHEPTARHGYALAHGFIADAFAGKL